MIDAQRFISQTGMTFATGRGTELTAVDNALAAYHKKSGPDTAGRLATAIVNWAKAKGLKANGDINTGRNAAVVKQLVTDVGNTKGGEACKNLKAVVGATAPAPGGGSAADLVAGVIGELNKCKNFACSDVGTFAGDINRSLSQQRQNEIYSKGIARAQATGYPVKNGAWDAGQLVQAYNAVYKKAAGECTSFALAAAHVLSTLKPVRNMPQIEIVSFRYSRNVPRENVDKVTKKRTPMMITDPKTGQKKQAFFHQVVTHVYCVVGRSGAAVAAGAKMPDSNTWGGNCRIVDCWLGSLGYECSFTVANYPKEGYLRAGFVSKVMGT